MQDREYSGLSLYLKDISRYPLLTDEEEIEYGRKVQEGDEEYREKFINSNLRLVVSIAKKYARIWKIDSKEDTFLELVEEGNLGLHKAVDNWDPERGNKFSTYATWEIRSTISRAISEDKIYRKAFIIPEYYQIDIRILERIRNSFESKYGREPSSEELFEKLQESKYKVKETSMKTIKKMNNRLNNSNKLKSPISLEGEIELDGGITSLRETIPDNTNQLEEISRRDVGDCLNECLSSLPEREKEITRLKFYEEKNNQKIADDLNLSRERVRQLVSKEIPKKARKLILTKEPTFVEEYYGLENYQERLSKRNRINSKKAS